MSVTLVRGTTGMSANALSCSMLDSFRNVWVCGRLDYQRAAEALEVAEKDAAQARVASPGSSEAPEIAVVEERVESARRRLAEVEAVLERQFDRFCGLTP